MYSNLAHKKENKSSHIKRRRVDYDELDNADEIDNDVTNENRLDKMNDSLMKFIVATDQSLSIVSNKYFKSFVSSLNSRFKLPCRQTVTHRFLLEISITVKEQIKIILNDKIEAIAITADNWTDNPRFHEP